MRLFDIIKSTLTTEKLIAEQELERVINDKSLETSKKVVMIKGLLNKITLTESSFGVFENLIKPTDETNEDKKQ